MAARIVLGEDGSGEGNGSGIKADVAKVNQKGLHGFPEYQNTLQRCGMQ